jgi:hypothetical protein
MWLAALCHTVIAMLQAVVSSAVESVLWHSPNDIIHMEVVGKLAAKF